MPIHRTACLAAALSFVAGSVVAQESPSLGLRGCTLPAAPSPEEPCHHQVARLGLDGVEAITDLRLPAAEPLQLATFDLTGMALVSPQERVVVTFAETGTAVAAAGETSPDADVEATGSVEPAAPPQ